MAALSTADAAGVCLVGMCASHIATPERWDTLMFMLSSWADQQNPVGTGGDVIDLYLSISYSPSMASVITSALPDLQLRYVKLHVHVKDKPTPQFRHYEALALIHCAHLHAADPWILFSDDTDLWHPLRVHTYRKLIEGTVEHKSYSLDGKLLKLSCLHIRTYADRSMDGIDESGIKTPTDVDTAISEGKLSMDHPAYIGDYVERAVPLRLVRQFLQDERSEPLLDRKMAKCYFLRFLHYADESAWHSLYDYAPTWLYYCRGGMSSNTAKTVDHVPDALIADPEFLRLRNQLQTPDSHIDDILYNMEIFSAQSESANPTYETWMEGDPRVPLPPRYAPLVDYIWSTKYLKALLNAPLLIEDTLHVDPLAPLSG
jgi:hypothetical protein